MKTVILAIYLDYKINTGMRPLSLKCSELTCFTCFHAEQQAQHPRLVKLTLDSIGLVKIISTLTRYRVCSP